MLIYRYVYGIVNAAWLLSCMYIDRWKCGFKTDARRTDEQWTRSGQHSWNLVTLCPSLQTTAAAILSRRITAAQRLRQRQFRSLQRESRRNPRDLDEMSTTNVTWPRWRHAAMTSRVFTLTTTLLGSAAGGRTCVEVTLCVTVCRLASLSVQLL